MTELAFQGSSAGLPMARVRKAKPTTTPRYPTRGRIHMASRGLLGFFRGSLVPVKMAGKKQIACARRSSAHDALACLSASGCHPASSKTPHPKKKKVSVCNEFVATSPSPNMSRPEDILYDSYCCSFSHTSELTVITSTARPISSITTMNPANIQPRLASGISRPT